MAHHIPRVIIRLIFFTVLLLSMHAPASAVKSNVYVFAVIPSAPPVTMHTCWSPFIERLSRDTGLEFRLKVYEKMFDFERDISNGVPDFLFASPLQAVVAHKAQGYVPLVRGSRPVSAAIYVRNDSPIRTVDDLGGRKIAFVGGKNL